MKNIKPILLVTLCCIIWGTTFTVVKEITSEINPFLLSTARNSIATILLILYLIVSKKLIKLKNKKSIIYGSTIGIILAIIYISQTLGLNYTTANNSAFISSITVILIPIILIFTGKVVLNKKQLASILIVLIGLYLLTIKNGLISINKGDLITFGSTFICALHIILSGIYVNKTEFLSLIFYQFLSASLFSIIGFILFKPEILNTTLIYDSSTILRVLYLGVLGTFFCFFVTVWCQQFIGSIFLALIFSMEPIFAGITSYLILDEKFNSKELLGAIVIFIGIIAYSISKNNNYEKSNSINKLIKD